METWSEVVIVGISLAPLGKSRIVHSPNHRDPGLRLESTVIAGNQGEDIGKQPV
jgi:hypothetical protein